MWSQQQLAQYHNDGFLACPGLFNTDELAPLNSIADEYCQHYRDHEALSGDDDKRVHWIRERSGAVRSLFAMHRQVEPYRQLLRSPKIAGPMKQIFAADGYVYHSKLNVKDAFEGAVWLWHQDYGYWQHDGVDDRMSSVLVMLDDTTIHGGCLLMVPGSHRWDMLDHHSDEKTTNYKQWCVTTDALHANLRDDSQIVPVTGKAGDVWFFDCRVLHGSGHNLSPNQRKSLIFACAHIDNRPKPVANPRPDWVVDQEFEPFTTEIKLT